MPVAEQQDLDKVAEDMFYLPERYMISKSKQDSFMRQRIILSFFILLFYCLSNMLLTDFVSVFRVKCFPVKQCLQLWRYPLS